VWGINTSGNLGLGDITNRSSPVQLAGTWSEVVLGGGSSAPFSLGRRTNGSLWVWGSGSQGVLGLGDTTSRNSPVQLTGTWASLASGTNHSAALRA